MSDVELRALAEVEPVTLQRRLFEECETAGWDREKRNSFAEECAHLHEEVSEAFREWRLHKDFEVRIDESGKPTGIPIELADVLIGLFYNAELHGFDLLAATEIKHAYNLTRSYEGEGRQLHPSVSAHDDDPTGHGDPVAGEGDTRTDPYVACEHVYPDGQRCVIPRADHRNIAGLAEAHGIVAVPDTQPEPQQ